MHPTTSYLQRAQPRTERGTMMTLVALLNSNLFLWTGFVIIGINAPNYQISAFSTVLDVSAFGRRRGDARRTYIRGSSTTMVDFHRENCSMRGHLKFLGRRGLGGEGWQLFGIHSLNTFRPLTSRQTSSSPSSSSAGIRLMLGTMTKAETTTSTQLYQSSDEDPSISESVSNVRKQNVIRGGASDGNPPAASFETEENDIDKKKKKEKKQKRLLILWAHGLSIAVIFSYYPNILIPISDKLGIDLSPLSHIISFQALFETIKLPVWNFVHAVSGMLMGGTIITTTVLEWMILNNNDSDGPSGNVVPPSIQSLWSLESLIVLPAVTGSMVSGLAQSYLMYDGIGFAPKYVKAALHMMLTFGIWWAIMDKKSQRQLVQSVEALQDVVDSTETNNNTSVWMKRKIANVVSCGLVILLYAIMILKPIF